MKLTEISESGAFHFTSKITISMQLKCFAELVRLIDHYEPYEDSEEDMCKKINIPIFDIDHS